VDLSCAISSHLRKYSEFHIDLNKFVKLSIAAFDFLAYMPNEANEQIDPKLPRNSNDLKPNRELSNLIADLIKGAGQRWYPTVYVNPHEEIEDIKMQLTESAIMRVYSAFEVFLDEINGSYSEYLVQRTEEDADSKSILNMFRKYGWPTKDILYLLPLFKFYNNARHCIVHQMGVANQSLIDISESDEYVEALNNWPTVIPGGQLSQPPKVKKDEKLVLEPHHAITYSDVCYRIVCEINKHLINMLGAEYIVKYVAVHQIMKADKLKSPACRDSYSYIKRILAEEYKIKNVCFSELRMALENAGIRRKCYQKYNGLLIKYNSNKRGQQ